ncbi:MAG: hypothetical protein V4510_11110 [bacterium]
MKALTFVLVASLAGCLVPGAPDSSMVPPVSLGGLDVSAGHGGGSGGHPTTHPGSILWSVRDIVGTNRTCTPVLCFEGRPPSMPWPHRGLPANATLTGFDLTLQVLHASSDPEIAWKVGCPAGGSCSSFGSTRGHTLLHMSATTPGLAAGTGVESRAYVATPGMTGRPGETMDILIEGRLNVIWDDSSHPADTIITHTVDFVGQTGYCVPVATPGCSGLRMVSYTTDPVVGQIESMDLTVTWTAPTTLTQSMTLHASCGDPVDARCSSGWVAVSVTGGSPLRAHMLDLPFARGMPVELSMEDDSSFGAGQSYHITGTLIEVQHAGDT